MDPELIVTELRNQISELQRTMAAVVARNEDVVAVMVALLAQHGDPTHVDVARAAQLRGCSEKTIRRAIAAGKLRLVIIPGTRVSGIPIEQIYSRWLPITAARRAIENARRECRLSIPTTARTGVHSASQTNR